MSRDHVDGTQHQILASFFVSDLFLVLFSSLPSLLYYHAEDFKPQIGIHSRIRQSDDFLPGVSLKCSLARVAPLMPRKIFPDEDPPEPAPTDSTGNKKSTKSWRNMTFVNSAGDGYGSHATTFGDIADKIPSKPSLKKSCEKCRKRPDQNGPGYSVCASCKVSRYCRFVHSLSCCAFAPLTSLIFFSVENVKRFVLRVPHILYMSHTHLPIVRATGKSTRNCVRLAQNTPKWSATSRPKHSATKGPSSPKQP